jgi:glycerol-3-phosphate acyltransferase PlsY
VVAGHVFPIWLKFRGGKGVATACGAFAALTPTAALAAVSAFAVMVWKTRYVSVGSMVAAVLLPPFAYATGAPGPVVLSALGVAVLVLARHRANAPRLSSGREVRLGEPLS